MTPSVTVTITALIDQMNSTVPVTAMNSNVRTPADVFLLAGYVMDTTIVVTGQMRRTVHVMSMSLHVLIILHLQRNVSASLLCVMDGMIVLMDQMRSTVIPTAL